MLSPTKTLALRGSAGRASSTGSARASASSSWPRAGARAGASHSSASAAAAAAASGASAPSACAAAASAARAAAAATAASAAASSGRRYSPTWRGGRCERAGGGSHAHPRACPALLGRAAQLPGAKQAVRDAPLSRHSHPASTRSQPPGRGHAGAGGARARRRMRALSRPQAALGPAAWCPGRTCSTAHWWCVARTPPSAAPAPAAPAQPAPPPSSASAQPRAAQKRTSAPSVGATTAYRARACPLRALGGRARPSAAS